MLKDNAFNILNIPMSATKSGIYSAAEDLSLLYDSVVCEDAAAALINPAKRTNAELDWFPEADEEAIRRIRAAADAGKAIGDDVIRGLDGISKVNAMTYDLGFLLSSLSGSCAEPDEGEVSANGQGLAGAVTGIDDCLRMISPEDLLDVINEKRESAGITGLTYEGIEEALRGKKTRLAMEISEILNRLDSEDYVELANKLAEHFRENTLQTYSRSMIPDLIDRYEIQQQSVIQAQTKKMHKATFRLTLFAMVAAYENRIDAFCAKLEAWLRYVRPLITAAALTGTENKYVAASAEDLRDLLKITMKAKNDMSAYKLAVRLKEYFAEVPSVVKWLDQYIEEATRHIEWFHHRSPEEWDRKNKEVNSKILKGIVILIAVSAVLILIRFGIMPAV